MNAQVCVAIQTLVLSVFAPTISVSSILVVGHIEKRNLRLLVGDYLVLTVRVAVMEHMVELLQLQLADIVELWLGRSLLFLAFGASPAPDGRSTPSS